MDDTALRFTHQLYAFAGISREAQLDRAYKLFNAGYSVSVHDHPPVEPCVPYMTGLRGSVGCIRVVDGGEDSTGARLAPSVVDISTTD